MPKIGYSSWAYAKIISAHDVRFQSFSSVPLSPIPLSPSPVPIVCTLSPVLCLTSLFLFFRPLYPISRLCSLPPVCCPLSYISCLSSSVFFSRLCSWSPVPIPCLTWSVPCLPSSFLRPLSPIKSTVPVSHFCSSIPLSFFSSASHPIFLCLLSFVPCHSYLQEREFFLVRYMY